MTKCPNCGELLVAGRKHICNEHREGSSGEGGVTDILEDGVEVGIDLLKPSKGATAPAPRPQAAPVPLAEAPVPVESDTFSAIADAAGKALEATGEAAGAVAEGVGEAVGAVAEGVGSLLEGL